MNRDLDRVRKGDDVLLTFSGRVADVVYNQNTGEIAHVRIESPEGASKVFFPSQFRDFTMSAIPDDVRQWRSA